MSAGSREGGGNVLKFILPANENLKSPKPESSDQKENEGKILSLDRKRTILQRQAEMEQQSPEDLAEKAFKMSFEIKNYNKERYKAIIDECEDLHSERIRVLFKDVWCDPDKITEDATYARAIMAVFSFRFSKANRK